MDIMGKFMDVREKLERETNLSTYMWKREGKLMSSFAGVIQTLERSSREKPVACYQVHADKGNL